MGGSDMSRANHTTVFAFRNLWIPLPTSWDTFRWKLAVVAVGSLAVYYSEQHILMTVSASVEDRVFWRTGERPDRGDYATFILHHPLAGDTPVRLTKRLVCWAGDTLTVHGRHYFCNGKYIGKARDTGLNGQSLPRFVFNGRLPPGKAFAAGTHVDSFDSRYWGLVAVADTERLLPIFAFTRQSNR